MTQLWSPIGVRLRKEWPNHLRGGVCPNPPPPQPSPPRMAQLMAAVKAARSLAELRALLDSAAPQRFDAILDCAVCGRVAALARDDADLARQLFAARAASWLQRPDGSSGKEGRNAANLLHSAAKVRPSAALVSDLAHAAVWVAPSFNAQNAANSLWALATLGVSDAAVVGPLAHAAVRVAPSFNAQDAANSLWAVATLGVSDAAVVGPLACAAVRVAPSFNAQDAANSLWAVATLGVSDGGVVGPLACAAVRVAPSFNLLHVQQALQAHCAVPGGCLDAAALGELRARFKSEPTTSSASQRRVAAALTRLGYSPLEEAPLLDGLLTIDMRLERLGGGCPIAVEFDGPSHFLHPLAPVPATGAASLTLNGATLLRNRLVASAGLALVCVPYSEWNEAERAGAAAEDAYLTRRLAEATAPAAPAPSVAAAGPPSAILQALCSAPVLGHPRYTSVLALAAPAPASEQPHESTGGARPLASGAAARGDSAALPSGAQTTARCAPECESAASSEGGRVLRAAASSAQAASAEGGAAGGAGDASAAAPPQKRARTAVHPQPSPAVTVGYGAASAGPPQQSHGDHSSSYFYGGGSGSSYGPGVYGGHGVSPPGFGTPHGYGYSAQPPGPPPGYYYHAPSLAHGAPHGAPHPAYWGAPHSSQTAGAHGGPYYYHAAHYAQPGAPAAQLHAGHSGGYGPGAYGGHGAAPPGFGTPHGYGYSVPPPGPPPGYYYHAPSLAHGAPHGAPHPAYWGAPHSSSQTAGAHGGPYYYHAAHCAQPGAPAAQLHAGLGGPAADAATTAAWSQYYADLAAYHAAAASCAQVQPQGQ